MKLSDVLTARMDELCRKQDFGTASVVRDVKQAVAVQCGDRDLNKKEVSKVNAFLDVLKPTH